MQPLNRKRHTTKIALVERDLRSETVSTCIIFWFFLSYQVCGDYLIFEKDILNIV